MSGWEYMVIHINVEPPAPAPPAAGGASAGGGEGAAGSKPVFSRSFLAKEFPQFYEGQPAGATPPNKPQHPAQQLQAFLNGHGSQGWELLGVFPVGSMSMLVFRRPLVAAEAAATETPAPPAASASAAAAVASEEPASGSAAAAEQVGGNDAAILKAVLERLDALERRSAPQRPARSSSQASPQVSEAMLARLAAQPTVGSAAAAQAIGLRSAGSLANLGARHGYQPGLVKVGANGLAAVYQGQATARHGGKPQRFWWVVSADQLEPPA